MQCCACGEWSHTLLTRGSVVVCLQAECDEDDDLQTLLQDMSTSPTLHESTDLIWNSNEEVGGVDMRPGSSCSGSILQPDSPVGDSQVGSQLETHIYRCLACLSASLQGVCLPLLLLRD